MSETRTNQEWLQDLNGGAAQEAAITDLRDILLRASLFYFSRNLGDFGGLSRGDILQKAEDCAQDALIAVMSHLQDFRGDSKFSTWAYKFAINNALMTSRREKWKGASLDEVSETGKEAYLHWAQQGTSDGPAPEQSAMQGELIKILQRVIEHDLTDRQQQVLHLMVFNEVPMDEVVLLLDANRNAVYKLLHDARKKLKTSLQAHGFGVDESLALFETHD